jgi:hypothetical protein
MADKIIEARNFYAKFPRDRVWVVFKTKGDPWRGLFLDFAFNTKEWASSKNVRSMKTGKVWIDASAQRRRRGSLRRRGQSVEDMMAGFDE